MLHNYEQNLNSVIAWGIKSTVKFLILGYVLLLFCACRHSENLMYCALICSTSYLSACYLLNL
jgi:hypothetical protein